MIYIGIISLPSKNFYLFVLLFLIEPTTVMSFTVFIAKSYGLRKESE